jgi:hypothetical protein
VAAAVPWLVDIDDSRAQEAEEHQAKEEDEEVHGAAEDEPVDCRFRRISVGVE